MELFNLMIKYYISTGVRSFKLVKKNMPVMFALVVYSVIINFSSMILRGTYFIGGLILAVITAACMGSYLYLIQSVINSRVVNANDFKYSFRIYLVRVMNTVFYLWIASLLYGFLSRALYLSPYGWVVTLVLYIAAIIALNPLPEMIYQTYHQEISLFRAAFEFMKENFWEWMAPNAIILGLLYFTIGNNITLPYSLDFAVIVRYIAGLFILFYAMVFRGILFRFLNESTRRSRLFKLRML